jgi:hypothetical protein
MASPGRGPDPDDWFDEPDTADLWAARVDRVARERQEGEVEDWVRETAAPAPARPSRSFRPSRAVVILAVLAVCALLGILAAAGVFSGGSPSTVTTTTAPATTAQTPTTTATTPTQPQVAVPTEPLKPGDSGAEVTKLQRALAQAGYSPGAIDGKYGAGTTAAVKQFQQAKGLSADGIAGPKTLAALKTDLQSG